MADEVAILAGGCFWCTEAVFLDVIGVKSVESGYTGGQTVNPRLHMAMHQVVANQLLAGDPPQTWQTVQRLAGLGYDWHNVMHMVMGPVSSFLHQAMTADQPFSRDEYRRQLNELPGDWPPPEEIGLS